MKKSLWSAVLLIALLLQCVVLTSCSFGPYTVTFDYRGGSPTTESVVVNKGEKVECPPEPVRYGYEFGGWYYNNRIWDFENDVVKKNMTLTARWQQLGYGNNPNIVEKDWDGSEFAVLTRADRNGSDFNVVDLSVGVKDALSDPISKAVFERNALVEHLFNVKITRKVVSDKDYDAIIADTMAYVNDYSAYNMPVAEAQSLAQQVALLDFNHEVGYINIQEEWWDTEAIKSVAERDMAYLLLGDINVVDEYATYCVFYNKRLAYLSGLPELYGEVKKGNWTIDNMKLWSAKAISSANSDGSDSNECRYGLVYSDSAASALVQSSGNMPFYKAKNGRFTSDLESYQLKNAIGAIRDGFMLDCAANNSWALNTDRNEMSEKQGRDVFTSEKALFFISYCGNNENIREKTEDVGMLPLPKLNGGQKEYGSAIRYGDATCYVVPYNVPDSDFSGFMLEALCFYSSNEHYNRNYVESEGATVPLNAVDTDSSTRRYFAKDTLQYACYSKLMCMYAANDDDREDMLDIIFENRVFDIACIGDIGGINGFIARSASSSQPSDDWSALMEQYGQDITMAVDEHMARLWEIRSKL